MKIWKIFLLLVIMMWALTGCSTTTVNLDEYVTIEVDGYDSVGTAVCSFDYDAFNADYSDKIKLSENTSDDMIGLDLLTGETASQLLLDSCVARTLDQTSGLSNGDVVTLTWDCDDELASEYFNCKLKYSDISYTVSNLEEVKTFDPFEYVEVSFSGIAPSGTVTITPDNGRDEMQYITFSANETYNLSNDDVVTVKADIVGTIDLFAEKFGAIPEITEKEYVVEGLAHYVTDVSEIPAEMMDKMDLQGQEVFRAYVASEWNNPDNLINISLEGNYFLTSKFETYFGGQNYLYLVYKITAQNPDPEEVIEFYYYVYYSDIIILEDGTCSVDLSKYVPTYFSIFSVGNYYYKGYEELDSLFNDCVVSQIDNYDYTSSIQ